MAATTETLVPDMSAIETLSLAFEAQQPQQIITWAAQRFGRELAIVTSFQASGMVIIDAAARSGQDIRVMSIDTGRLPEETYTFMEQVRRHYGIHIEVIYPETETVQQMVAAGGINLFYKDLNSRLLCCQVRKVEPLQRALSGLDAWITGLRRDQWKSRAATPKIMLDMVHGGIIKLNPLADWREEDVDAYIRRYGVPKHPLYAKGYTSIGCAPCTRAVHSGEDSRAGRWWWEQDSPKECGMHCGIERRGY